MAANAQALPTSWQPELKRTWSSTCNGAVTSIVLSSKGKVAVSTATSVYLFDPPPSLTLKKEITAGPAGITAAAFTSKGTDVVSGGADGFLKWWQVETGEETCVTQFPERDEGGSEPAVQEVACSKAGYVAAASGRYVCVFGAGGEYYHTLTAEAKTADKHQLQLVNWLDDTTVCAVSGAEVSVWSVSQEKYEEVVVFAAIPQVNITFVAASPNGRFLAAACENGMVQVWDIQQQHESSKPSMDPILKIHEGIESGAKIEKLQWDATSKLLAAAVANDVLVWDVSAVKDGKVESYVCMGYEQGVKVTCLDFQASGSLLASAADNGQCLVHDVNSFGTNGVVNGLINHVASGSVGLAESGDAVKAIAWHTGGYLLLGTEAGSVVALQVQKMPQQTNSAASLPQQQQPQSTQQMPAKFRDQNMRRQANGPANMDHSFRPRGPRPQAGWGGEPLATAAVPVVADPAASNTDPPANSMFPGGGRGRGRGRGMRGDYPPFERKGSSGYPTGPGGASAGPEGAPPHSPEQPAAVMAAPWGMVATMPGMAPMWVRPMPGMAMPYAIPYGQMIPTMGPMAPGMAPGMTYMPAQGMAPAAAGSAPGGSAPGAGPGSSSMAPAGGRGMARGRGGQQQQQQHSMQNAAQGSASAANGSSGNAAAGPAAINGPSIAAGGPERRPGGIPGPTPPPGPAPPSAYERPAAGPGRSGPVPAAAARDGVMLQQQQRYGGGDREQQQPPIQQQQQQWAGGFPADGSNRSPYAAGGQIEWAASEPPAADAGPPRYGGRGRGYANSPSGPGGMYGDRSGQQRERYMGRGAQHRDIAYPAGQYQGGQGDMQQQQQQHMGGGQQQSQQHSYGAQNRTYGSMQAGHTPAAPHTASDPQLRVAGSYGGASSNSRHGGSSSSSYQQGGGERSGSSGYQQAGGGGADGGGSAAAAAPQSPTAVGGPPAAAAAAAGVHQSPVPVATMMPRPMFAQPVWMYHPQAAAGWGMAAYPQQWPGMAAPYYTAGYYHPGGAYPTMVQPHSGMPVAALAPQGSMEGSPGPVAAHRPSPGPASGPGAKFGDTSSNSPTAEAADNRQDSTAAGPGPGSASMAPRQGGQYAARVSGAGSDASGPEEGPSRSSSYVRAGYGGSGGVEGNRALYVGNLAPTVDEGVLTTQFAVFGEVQHVQVMRDRESRQHRGYAFVTFASAPSAQAAMHQLNGISIAGPFQGRPLRVSPSNKAR